MLRPAHRPRQSHDGRGAEMSKPTTQQVIDVLIRGRARIERGWCQGFLAMDADGNLCDPTSPRACKW